MDACTGGMAPSTCVRSLLYERDAGVRARWFLGNPNMYFTFPFQEINRFIPLLIYKKTLTENKNEAGSGPQ